MKLEVENLSYTYSPGTVFSKKALENVSFSVEEGSFVGIIGHSGSGKSTLVRHLNGLCDVQKGEIRMGNRILNNEKKYTKGLCFEVGIVFQYPEQQLFADTVYNDIAFGPKNMGLNDKEIELRVKTAANLVGLSEEILSKSPFGISGGQKRRVALAGVIAMEPKILVLDEPTAGLDPKGRNEILSAIGKVHKEMGMSVILVSHSMEDVSLYCEKLIVMNEGKVYLSGKRNEVFKHTKELEAIGLSSPAVTIMAQRLKDEYGIDLGDNIYTVDGVFDAIINWKEKHKC